MTWSATMSCFTTLTVRVVFVMGQLSCRSHSGSSVCHNIVTLKVAIKPLIKRWTALRKSALFANSQSRQEIWWQDTATPKKVVSAKAERAQRGE
ncbi:hypothetical protein J6590_092845 [Homalodisca vitripennis]|nr:hypothetical protein J6590_092845 [Homalodisca vitripennis]